MSETLERGAFGVVLFEKKTTSRFIIDGGSGCSAIRWARRGRNLLRCAI